MVLVFNEIEKGKRKSGDRPYMVDAKRGETPPAPLSKGENRRGSRGERPDTIRRQ